MRRVPIILVALLTALAAHLIALCIGYHIMRRDLDLSLLSRLGDLRFHGNPPPAIDRAPDELGDVSDLGPSINAMPGDDPLQSPLVDPHQSQAAMQLDPTGDNGQPAEASARPSDQAARQRILDQPPSDADPSRTLLPDDTAAPHDTVPLRPVHPAPPTPPAQAAAQSPPAQSPTSGAPGGPLQQADSSSDPFVSVAAQFVAGKIEARMGRKFKIFHQPEFGEAAQMDGLGMVDPTVVLRLKIDASGNVISAEILQSSGSNNIDQPFRRAALEDPPWWFEPPIDPKTGKPTPATLDLTIGIP